MAISNFFKKLIFGSESNKAYKPNSFYEHQIENLDKIWNNKTINDFGIERLLRLLLQLISFIIPSGLVRELSGKNNLLFRKVNIEIFLIIKVIILIIALKYDWTKNTFILVLVIILFLDTLHFLISRIFLNDVFRSQISNKRSILTAFINFIEMCLFFAFVYTYIDHTNCDLNRVVFFNDTHITNLQATYFSFVTSATIGYGDITTKDPLVMKVIIAQIIVSLFIVVVVFARTISKIDDDTFYNKK